MNIRPFFNRLAPPACLLCGGPSGAAALCAGCRDDLPWHRAPCCPQCALPTPAGALCGACLKHPPAFARTQAALVYAWPLDRLIPRLKYHGQLAAAPVLAECLRDCVENAAPPDRLIPMPLHAARVRERGFNHAAEIARELAKRLRLPLDATSCRRVRDTAPQMGLRHDARHRNVRGAFACTADLAGLRIAVVDDVMTTGTSLDELAKTLIKAGAASVENWIVARTLPPGEADTQP